VSTQCPIERFATEHVTYSVWTTVVQQEHVLERRATHDTSDAITVTHKQVEPTQPAHYVQTSAKTYVDNETYVDSFQPEQLIECDASDRQFRLLAWLWTKTRLE